MKNILAVLTAPLRHLWQCPTCSCWWDTQSCQRC